MCNPFNLTDHNKFVQNYCLNSPLYLFCQIQSGLCILESLSVVSSEWQRCTVQQSSLIPSKRTSLLLQLDLISNVFDAIHLTGV